MMVGVEKYYRRGGWKIVDGCRRHLEALVLFFGAVKPQDRAAKETIQTDEPVQTYAMPFLVTYTFITNIRFPIFNLSAVVDASFKHLTSSLPWLLRSQTVTLPLPSPKPTWPRHSMTSLAAKELLLHLRNTWIH